MLTAGLSRSLTSEIWLNGRRVDDLTRSPTPLRAEIGFIFRVSTCAQSLGGGHVARPLNPGKKRKKLMRQPGRPAEVGLQDVRRTGPTSCRWTAAEGAIARALVTSPGHLRR
jgi:hypothetical protein